MFPSFAFVAALVLMSSAVCADEPKPAADDETKSAQERLKEYLTGIKGRKRPESHHSRGTASARPSPSTPSSRSSSRNTRWRVAPEPLKSSNVVVVPKNKDAKPVPITDVKELEKFFKENARPVKTAKEATDAIKAWLRVSAELNQDGFYKFRVKRAGAEQRDTITASGEAPVDPAGGNKGEVTATLTFKDGKLAKAETKANLTPGVRPICQATKLLDPDPIVRGMAEQCIRVMGSAAKPYLDDQRAKASPELKAAIDRIWAQILKEGR